MLDELMWQGIEDGYRRLAADEAESAAYRSETAGGSEQTLAGSRAPLPRSTRSTTHDER